MEHDDTVNWEFYQRLERRRRMITCEEHVRPLLRMMTEIKSMYTTYRMVFKDGQIVESSVEAILPPEAQGHYDALADVVAHIRQQYQND